MPQDGSSNFMMVNLPVVRSSFAFLTLAAVVLLSRHLIAHQVSVDTKKYLLGLYLLLVVVFTFRFGMCRLVVHFVRLLAIQQPGNTHGIYPSTVLFNGLGAWTKSSWSNRQKLVALRG